MEDATTWDAPQVSCDAHNEVDIHVVEEMGTGAVQEEGDKLHREACDGDVVVVVAVAAEEEAAVALVDCVEDSDRDWPPNLLREDELEPADDCNLT